ncbi:MAG TPA: TetR/AcrR family transcriptional regulator [Desulfarculaceae bacterium]|nr:TetR/AcrR family transcriptional regulator [Desulfarculaceae bacterium]
MSTDKQHTKEEILAATIPLFAEKGYAGVSMREIARTVGLKAASLYHHFPNKQTLYIEAMIQTYSKYADLMKESFTLQASPEMRLRHLIEKLCRIVHDDDNFRRLLEREILDGDETRLRLLANHVFGDFFRNINELCLGLTSKLDPHMLAISITSLIIHHYQITPIRTFMPGFKPSHNDPEVLAQHIFQLLKNGYT